MLKAPKSIKTLTNPHSIKHVNIVVEMLVWLIIKLRKKLLVSEYMFIVSKKQTPNK